ncbi:DUF805 domain-containing protein [Flavobacterium sp. ANB]|uniref:DUF805 domain-containing protein n=1 Tax=unclassified Flavobacterium TaxID=196869 RepID=UPI0012B97037|nr:MULTISPECIES: DUF805 domain-containing protein [unclassified Flavobacterium]MBF4516051.1 DUF805 domain-containing protein [Flavobacterium sp. ANB]MTD69053.1 DUF805 domain-containing protein [Flavobacterium sp. LC2016-13]
MIEDLKKLWIFWFSFSGKIGRNEFKVYFLIDSILEIGIIVLYANVNLDNRNILNLFYLCILLLLKFIPMQVAITRRLRDINLNPVFIFINFVPILNLLFRIYLSVAKEKVDLSIEIKEIGN